MIVVSAARVLHSESVNILKKLKKELLEIVNMLCLFFQISEKKGVQSLFFSV